MALTGTHTAGDTGAVADANLRDNAINSAAAQIVTLTAQLTTLQATVAALTGAAPVITVPGAPTNVVATAGNTIAAITFTAPTNNGGAPVTTYTATSNPGGLTGTGPAASPITVAGLTNGAAYTFTVKATNSAGQGPASPASAAITPTAGSTGTTTTTYPLTPLTRSGANLQIGGVTKRLAGVNMYWVGLDDNAGINFPSHTTITNAMTGAREMGSTLARAHTVGISVGTSQSYLTSYTGTTPNYVESNMDSADWAVYQAGLKGIYLMVPLTDNWNYYHGGKWNFVHWAYQQNPTGFTADVIGGTKDDKNERVFFANTAPGLRVRALFKDYISHWLNHVNPYTGLAYKDDPTIAIIETGNELYFSAQVGNADPIAPDPGWVQDIASYVKGIAANKLVADGGGSSGTFASNTQGITAAACDIIDMHYYPATTDYSSTVGYNSTSSNFGSNSARQQLAADATSAASASKAIIVGEFAWTRADVGDWYSDLLSNTTIDAAMAWAYIAGTEGHGGPFGGDDYPVHRPYLGANEISYAPALAGNISALSAIAPTNGAGPTVTGPIINIMTSSAVARVEGVAATKYAAGMSTGTAPTLSIDTTTFAEGTSSLKATTVAAGYPYIYVAGNSADVIASGAPVTPGVTYTATVFAKNGTGFTSGNAHITWFDGAGNYLSGVDGTVAYTLNTTTWTQLLITATAPTGARYAVPQFQAAAVQIAAGSVAYLDKFGIFAGTSATPWVAPA